MSLVASVLTFVYAGVQAWRKGPSGGESAGQGGRASLGDVVADAGVFLLVVVTMLFVAALAHYALSLASATALAVPVWLFALFVIVVVGFVQTMPGETFEEKTETFVDRLDPDAVEDREDAPTDADE